MSTRLVLAAASLAAILSAGPAPVRAEEMDTIVVTQDQAKIVRIAAPAATIIIGNPAIADATMQDSQTLVITGRSSGTTNFIVLDTSGEKVTEQLIAVEGPTANNVSVYRGAARFSYNCAPNCQPNVVPGDNNDYFAAVVSQNAQRTSTAAGNAETPAQPQ